MSFYGRVFAGIFRSPNPLPPPNSPCRPGSLLLLGRIRVLPLATAARWLFARTRNPSEIPPRT